MLMKIFLPGGKSAADVAFLLVHVKNFADALRQGRVDLLQAVRAVFMYRTLTNPKFLCSLTHSGFMFDDIICNFKQLLNKYRVEYAKSLLLEGTYSASSLFRKCGFASQSVFYAAFHKIVGASPLQFLYKAPSGHRKRFKVLL